MKDGYGREINYMRISVTDRCNLRCRYCMPEGISKCSMEEILTYEEILEIAKAAIRCGISRFKITGGEPLVRLGVEELIGEICRLPGTGQVTLTTNGILLEERLPALVEAGISAVNVSLDTRDPEIFRQITGFDQIDKVMRGIKASVEAGVRTKINAVLSPERAQTDFYELIEMAHTEPVDVRFIELMPIGAGDVAAGVDNSGLLQKLQEHFPGTVPDEAPRGNGPAVYYALPGYTGRIGFISAIHGKFCASCNRVRLTSTGFLKPCLCYEDGVDLRTILRACPDPREREEKLVEALREGILKKPSAHIFENPAEVTEKRLMAGIGG